MNQIIYRARILGTSNYSASALVELMQSWVNGGQASVNVGASRLQIDPTCPVFLDNLIAPDCSPPTTETPTSPTTSSSTTATVTSTTEPPTRPSTGNGPSAQPRVSSTKISAGEMGGIIVGVLIAVFLLVLVILLVGLFVRGWKSGQSIRYKCSPLYCLYYTLILLTVARPPYLSFYPTYPNVSSWYKIRPGVGMPGYKATSLLEYIPV